MLKKLGKAVILLAVYWGICILFLKSTETLVERRIKAEYEIYQINFGLFGLEIFGILLLVVFIFGVWFPHYFAGEPGKWYPLRIKIAATLGSILLMGGISVLYGQWYEVFTMEGVKTKHFFKEEQYDWEDVSYYTIDTRGRELSMKLVMADGKHMNVFGNYSSCIDTSEAYTEQFPEGIYDYALWLDKKLEEQGKELRIKEKEKLEKKLKGMDYYLRQVAQEIMAE